MSFLSHLRLPAACAAYGIYAVQAFRHGSVDGRALRFRLLAHYLWGSGRDLDLGVLKVWFDHYDIERVVVTPTEWEWVEEGFSLAIAVSGNEGIPEEEYHPCFGAFYIRPQVGDGDGQIMVECRDLYDWHPTGLMFWPEPEAVTLAQGIRLDGLFRAFNGMRVRLASLHGRLGRATKHSVIKGAALAVVKTAYRAAGLAVVALARFTALVDRVFEAICEVEMAPEDKAEEVAIHVPDKFWILMGGRPFVSTWRVPMAIEDFWDWWYSRGE